MTGSEPPPRWVADAARFENRPWAPPFCVCDPWIKVCHCGYGREEPEVKVCEPLTD